MSDFEGLTIRLSEIIKKHIQECDETFNDEIEKVADETISELKTTSPKGRRGKYAKGWGKTSRKTDSPLKEVTIHNKNEYRLTHLLEFGHSLKNGGRTRAFPHIKPAEEKAIQKLIERLKP